MQHYQVKIGKKQLRERLSNIPQMYIAMCSKFVTWAWRVAFKDLWASIH